MESAFPGYRFLLYNILLLLLILSDSIFYNRVIIESELIEIITLIYIFKGVSVCHCPEFVIYNYI